jgi:hypothetical protein
MNDKGGIPHVFFFGQIYSSLKDVYAQCVLQIVDTNDLSTMMMFAPGGYTGSFIGGGYGGSGGAAGGGIPSSPVGPRYKVHTRSFRAVTL